MDSVGRGRGEAARKGRLTVDTIVVVCTLAHIGLPRSWTIVSWTQILVEVWRADRQPSEMVDSVAPSVPYPRTKTKGKIAILLYAS